MRFVQPLMHDGTPNLSHWLSSDSPVNYSIWRYDYYKNQKVTHYFKAYTYDDGAEVDGKRHRYLSLAIDACEWHQDHES